MQKVKKNKVNYYIQPKECLEINCISPNVENILVAHHRQIEFSKMKLENMYKEMTIIAKQHKLQVNFISEVTDKYVKLSVNYDVLDLMYAMTLLERSIIEN